MRVTSNQYSDAVSNMVKHKIYSDLSMQMTNEIAPYCKLFSNKNIYIKFSAHDTLLEFKYLSYDSEDPCGTPMSNSGA
jgi:hypothetical protein